MFEKLTIIVEIPENNLYFNTNLIGVIMNSIIFFSINHFSSKQFVF